MADMICAWAGYPCPIPDCENCAVRERERNIRNIDTDPKSSGSEDK